MNCAIIGVGSNIDPDTHIQRAQTTIARSHKLLGVSDFVTTAPIGTKNQPDFRNGAFLIQTNMNLTKLKTWLKQLEIQLGRIKTADKYGPRTIDLDIAVWNGKIIDEDYYTRDFLRNAIRQLMPDIEE